MQITKTPHLLHRLLLPLCLLHCASKCLAEMIPIPSLSEPFAVRIAVTKPSSQQRGPTFPQPLQQPFPEFPLAMRQAKISGEVIVSFTVEADGRISGLKVVKESQRVFGEVSIRAVRKWRFMPWMNGNSVAPIALEYLIRFELPVEKE